MSDRRRRPAWWRLWSVQGSFAPDARQWLGWIVALDGSRRRDPRDPATAWVDDEPRVMNTNPHLFGVLVGARIGIEDQGTGEDARTLARTITEVLPSTLGAVGDRLVWTGIRPALVAVAAALTPWFGVWPAVAAWILFGVGQAWFRVWSFDWARARGAAVAADLSRLPLHRVADRARWIGACAVGAVTADQFLVADVSASSAPEVAAVLLVGAVAAWRRIDPVWTLVALAVVVSGVGRVT